MSKIYNITTIFISRLGYYDEDLNIFLPFPTYGRSEYEVIKATNKGNYIAFNKVGRGYKHYKDLENFETITWGELIPIWSYLNDSEKQILKVSHSRLNMISNEINNYSRIKEKNILSLTNHKHI